MIDQLVVSSTRLGSIIRHDNNNKVEYIIIPASTRDPHSLLSSDQQQSSSSAVRSGGGGGGVIHPEAVWPPRSCLTRRSLHVPEERPQWRVPPLHQHQRRLLAEVARVGVRARLQKHLDHVRVSSARRAVLRVEGPRGGRGMSGRLGKFNTRRIGQ